MSKSTPPIRLLIAGSHGRMGQAVAACVREDGRFCISAEVNSNDSFQQALSKSDVSIDFTRPETTLDFAQSAAEVGKPIIIGTTGHAYALEAALAQYTCSIPVVLSPNFSVGVNVLFWLTGKAAKILGTGCDLEIIEMHHRHKKDAPSGTAVKLAGILAKIRSLQAPVETGYNNSAACAFNKTIGVHSLRGGDVIGDHTVILASDGERLELTHKASNRSTFALGALHAAAWALQKPAGLYTMWDVLGLEE